MSQAEGVHVEETVYVDGEEVLSLDRGAPCSPGGKSLPPGSPWCSSEASGGSGAAAPSIPVPPGEKPVKRRSGGRRSGAAAATKTASTKGCAEPERRRSIDSEASTAASETSVWTRDSSTDPLRDSRASLKALRQAVERRRSCESRPRHTPLDDLDRCAEVGRENWLVAMADRDCSGQGQTRGQAGIRALTRELLQTERGSAEAGALAAEIQRLKTQQAPDQQHPQGSPRRQDLGDPRPQLPGLSPRRTLPALLSPPQLGRLAEARRLSDSTLVLTARGKLSF